MDFHLEFFPKPFDAKISHRHTIMLVGSCFTEQIGAKLAQHKFSVLDNPHGILFNPVSIARSLDFYISGKRYREEDLFFGNECWNSWEHHSRFSHPDKMTCLQWINNSQHRAHLFLKKADWLLLTLGSAFVYELENNTVVANCHKVPTDKFSRRMLSVDEVVNAFQAITERLKRFNPALRIIYTISPVRHLRDGFLENNRSKATLILAVQRLLEEQAASHYFPAFELVIDDLRDYRFFAEDMVHPNYAATQYVWEKFSAACIDGPSQELMKEISSINTARSHRAFNPASLQHKNFLKAHLEKVKKLQEQYPYLNFEEEINHFKTQG